MKTIATGKARPAWLVGLATVMLLIYANGAKAQGTGPGGGSTRGGTGGTSISGGGSGSTGMSFGGGGSSFSGGGSSFSGGGNSFTGGGTSFSGGGTSFSGGGSSFSGGGSSFSGGGSSFSGGTQMSGGGGYRGTGGAGATGYTSPGGTGTGNPFGTYFSNPLAMGRPGNTTTNATGIGQPLYTAGTSNTGTTGNLLGGGTNRGGMMGMTGSGVGLLNQGGGYGAGSQRRMPASIFTVSFPTRPAPQPSEIRADLQGIIARSSAFVSNKEISVATEGSVVVLRGAVASQRERQLAENMLRLTPGVRQIRNELQVRETAPAPRKTP